jgi:predicted transcriptional regulator
MNWELYSFVVRSKKRKKILLSLKSQKIPTQIASEVKSSVSHVSRTLGEFVEKGIAKCLTPKQKVGRIYSLTKEGKEIQEKLK